jgi:TolB-like protein
MASSSLLLAKSFGQRLGATFSSHRTALLIAILAIVGPLTGCGFSKRYQDLPTFWPYDVFDSENQSVGRFKTTYLADQIHGYFRGNAAGPIAVASFVDLDNLYGTSTFGRMLGEQLISELSMKGYNVREIRQSEALQVMAEQGEFGLSRDLKQLRRSQDLAGVVVGTYTISPVRVYVNARLIDPSTSLVMSAASVEMGKTAEIEKMLRNNSFPTALERIPVRNVSYSNYPLPYYWPNPNKMDFRNEAIEKEESAPAPTLKDSFEVKPKSDKRAQLELPSPRL